MNSITDTLFTEGVQEYKNMVGNIGKYHVYTDNELAHIINGIVHYYPALKNLLVVDSTIDVSNNTFIDTSYRITYTHRSPDTDYKATNFASDIVSDTKYNHVLFNFLATEIKNTITQSAVLTPESSAITTLRGQTISTTYIDPITYDVSNHIHSTFTLKAYITP